MIFNHCVATKSLLVIHQFFAHEMICKLNSNISHMSSIILRVVVNVDFYILTDLKLNLHWIGNLP